MKNWDVTGSLRILITLHMLIVQSTVQLIFHKITFYALLKKFYKKTNLHHCAKLSLIVIDYVEQSALFFVVQSN